MKYFLHTDGQRYAFDDDGSQDHLIVVGMRAMTESEIYAHLNPLPTQEGLAALEGHWRTGEQVIIANQLDAIEEADAGGTPKDLRPGTRVQWLAYRGEVRNWVEGEGDFPDSSKRPARPN